MAQQIIFQNMALVVQAGDVSNTISQDAVTFVGGAPVTLNSTELLVGGTAFGDGYISGPSIQADSAWSFATSVVVPTPIDPTQAATKSYVDGWFIPTSIPGPPGSFFYLNATEAGGLSFAQMSPDSVVNPLFPVSTPVDTGGVDMLVTGSGFQGSFITMPPDWPGLDGVYGEQTWTWRQYAQIDGLGSVTLSFKWYLFHGATNTMDLIGQSPQSEPITTTLTFYEFSYTAPSQTMVNSDRFVAELYQNGTGAGILYTYFEGDYYSYVSAPGGGPPVTTPTIYTTNHTWTGLNEFTNFALAGAVSLAASEATLALTAAGATVDNCSLTPSGYARLDINGTFYRLPLYSDS